MSDKSNIENQYSQASIATANNLRNVAHTLMATDVSQLTLPEVDKAINIISDMVPAGNIPSVILNGLARLKNKQTPEKSTKRDINLLFRGVSQVLDQAVYGALFAGPAAVIWGYQNILKLAGKSPDDAFPEGTWQFYVDYALREDTARHTNETHGFDSLLTDHQLYLSKVDRITAWVMTAIHLLNQYSELLENEWRERIFTQLLYQQMADTADAPTFAKLYSRWERQRPYSRRIDAGQDSYPVYRRRLFDDFIREALVNVPRPKALLWKQNVENIMAEALPAYLQQMNIVSYLAPGDYGETRTVYSLRQAKIAIIHEGKYYLIPVMQDANTPSDILRVREQVTAIVQNLIPASPPHLHRLVTVKRASLSRLKEKLHQDNQASLDSLKYAPILINTDTQDFNLPLAEIRQAERGIGDHALTIFDTGKTFIFDQSHIYFDGAWGTALAEIMTNEALSWARYLVTLPQPRPDTRNIHGLTLNWQASDEQAITKAPTIVREVTAESEQVNIKAILGLRKIFKKRSDLIQLTVNDLLVLYRAIHAVSYQPSQTILSQLQQLNQQDIASTTLEALSNHDNPAILIPVDASPYSPSERLYPMSFEVPLYDLNLLGLHQDTLDALNAYQNKASDRTATYTTFDDLQRTYLATLAGFGAVLSRAKEIAISGESASVGTIKLLAHMPPSLKALLDDVPSRVDKLNDIIKGKEVFSNVGAVASTSTLTRFITAKDDNEKKTLAWGVITDAKRTMRLSLRDFRPHVGLLLSSNEKKLAQAITQDYLDSYATGLNAYIRDLRHITLTSRETRIATKMENLDE